MNDWNRRGTMVWEGEKEVFILVPLFPSIVVYFNFYFYISDQVEELILFFVQVTHLHICS